MEFIETQRLSTAQRAVIKDLWNAVYPINIQHTDITGFDNYLSKLSDQYHIVVQSEREDVLGWYFDFIRDNERWFSMLLSFQIQGQGVGSRLLKIAKKRNEILNGWVIDHDRYKTADGEKYRSPLRFYQKNGFEVIKDVRLEIENLSAVKIQWCKF